MSAPRIRGLGWSQKAAGALVGGILLLLPAGTALAAGTTEAHAETARPQTVVTAPTQVVEHQIPVRVHEPAPAAGPTHTVQRGDSLWTIAEERLGDGKRWNEIAKLNEGKPMADGSTFRSADYVEVGWVLALPPNASPPAEVKDAHVPATGPASAPGASPGDQAGEKKALPKTVTVKPGDTLSDIAEELLGDGDRYPEIFAANKDAPQSSGVTLTDPNAIEPGWTLAIPGGQDPAETGAQPPAQVPGGAQVPGPAQIPAPAQVPAPAQQQPPVTPPEQQPPVQQAPVQQAPVQPPPAQQQPAQQQPAQQQPAQQPPVQQQPAQLPKDVPTPPWTAKQDAPNGLATPPDTAGRSGSDQAAPAGTEAKAPDPGSDDSSLPVGVIALGAVGAAAVLGALLVRRRLQQSVRRDGRRIAMPAPAAADLEQQLRATETPDALDLFDRTLRTLCARMSDTGRTLPLIDSVQLTDRRLELHLAAPSPPLYPFEAVDGDHMHWTCPADAELLHTSAAANVPAPYPALAVLGETDDGRQLLVDLESLGVVGLTDGSGEDNLAVLRALSVELLSNVWSDDLCVTVVGFGRELRDVEREGRQQLRYAYSLDEALSRLNTWSDEVVGLLDDAKLTSPRQARTKGILPDTWPPEIVLSLEPLTEAHIGHIQRLTNTYPRAAAAIVAPVHAEPWLSGLGVTRLPTVPGVVTPSRINADVHVQRLEDPQYQALVSMFTVSKDLDGVPADDVLIPSQRPVHEPAPAHVGGGTMSSAAWSAVGGMERPARMAGGTAVDTEPDPMAKQSGYSQHSEHSGHSQHSGHYQPDPTDPEPDERGFGANGGYEPPFGSGGRPIGRSGGAGVSGAPGMPGAPGGSGGGSGGFGSWGAAAFPAVGVPLAPPERIERGGASQDTGSLPLPRFPEEPQGYGDGAGNGEGRDHEPQLFQGAGANPATESGVGPGSGRTESAPGESAHAEPAYGEPTYAEPAYGDPTYGEPAYGESVREEPAHEERADEERVYGEPAPEGPAPEEPAYGEPRDEDSPYGEQVDDGPAAATDGQPPGGGSHPGEPSDGARDEAGPYDVDSHERGAYSGGPYEGGPYGGGPYDGGPYEGGPYDGALYGEQPGLESPYGEPARPEPAHTARPDAGAPAEIQSYDELPYAQEPYGEPSYGGEPSVAASFGESSFGESSSSEPAFAHPGFGTPAPGEQSHGETAVGEPAFVHPVLGEPGTPQPEFVEGRTAEDGPDREAVHDEAVLQGVGDPEDDHPYAPAGGAGHPAEPVTAAEAPDEGTAVPIDARSTTEEQAPPWDVPDDPEGTYEVYGSRPTLGAEGHRGARIDVPIGAPVQVLGPDDEVDLVQGGERARVAESAVRGLEMPSAEYWGAPGQVQEGLTAEDSGMFLVVAPETETVPVVDAPEVGSTWDVAPPVAAATVETPSVTGAPAEGFAPTYPEIRILGQVDLIGVGEEVEHGRRARLTELAAWIALHPGGAVRELDAAVWPLGVTATARNSAISQLRRWVGTNQDGTSHLPAAVGGEGYRFATGFACDWFRFRDLVAVGLYGNHDVALDYARALDIVRDAPFDGVGPRRYVWAEPFRQQMIAEIVDVAARLADYHLDNHDPQAAKRACSVGLVVCPESQMLYRTMFRATHITGDRAELDYYVDRLDGLLAGLGAEPEPLTVELLRDLLDD
nr:LysM peptidoglycan-binding domain-containing protein [Streptomyces sp. SID3343]